MEHFTPLHSILVHFASFPLTESPTRCSQMMFIRESNKMQSDNSMTTQKKEEIRLRKLEQERIQANLFKAVVDLKQ